MKYLYKKIYNFFDSKFCKHGGVVVSLQTEEIEKFSADSLGIVQRDALRPEDHPPPVVKEFTPHVLMRNNLLAELVFFILKSASLYQSKKNRAFLIAQDTLLGVNELQLCRLLDLALGGASERIGCNSVHTLSRFKPPVTATKSRNSNAYPLLIYTYLISSNIIFAP